MKLQSRLLHYSIAAFCAIAPAWSQQVSGSISGTVHDSQGAVVPNAKIAGSLSILAVMPNLALALLAALAVCLSTSPQRLLAALVRLRLNAGLAVVVLYSLRRKKMRRNQEHQEYIGSF